MFFSSDRHPEYIGQSDDVRRRLSQHEEKFWFRPPIVETACYFEILDKRLRLQMEAMLIRVTRAPFVMSATLVNSRGE